MSRKQHIHSFTKGNFLTQTTIFHIFSLHIGNIVCENPEHHKKLKTISSERARWRHFTTILECIARHFDCLKQAPKPSSPSVSNWWCDSISYVIPSCRWFFYSFFFTFFFLFYFNFVTFFRTLVRFMARFFSFVFLSITNIPLLLWKIDCLL